MSNIKRIGALFLAVMMMVFAVPLKAEAAYQYRENKKVIVNGVEKCVIMTLEDSYEYNTYASVKGIAYALADTDKAFDVDVSGSSIQISTQGKYGDEPSVWEDEEMEDHSKLSLERHELFVDGEEKKYYSMIGSLSKNEHDAFMEPIIISMILDVDIRFYDGDIVIDTSKPFSLTAMDMENSGLLQGINTLVIGDVTTGDIYYEYDGDKPFPIASTTKLMTYYLVMEAISNGEISANDTVTISKNAEILSKTSDGVVPMEEGDTANIQDLFTALLLASSNESAYALAEHVAGSHEAFVQRMNQKAEELGFIDTKFYNCNGLPVYEDQVMPAKIHNHMTGEEMFSLAGEIMNNYPQILDITSIKKTTIPSFGKEVKNTNALLYNLNQVRGLKTGTTNRSGACLVTCAEVEKDGEKHYLVSVLLGAESEIGRATVSEIAMRYAINEINGMALDTEKKTENISANPELVIQKLIRTMEQK